MSERADNTLAAEVPAFDIGASTVALPRIALFHADETLLAHVEQTLAAMQAPVVYRAAIGQVESAALAAANPEVALINLDDRCGEELDGLTATLDQAGVPIVFNDADISQGLEGWARARWARHLCAKLRGRNDVDPPRPQASATQSIASAAGSASSTDVSDAHARSSAPSDRQPEAVEAAASARPLSQGEIDSMLADFPSESVVTGAETQALSAQVDALLANAAEHAPHEPAPWEVVAPFADQQESAAAEQAGATAPVLNAKQAKQTLSLVEEFTPVVSAPRETRTEAPAASFGSGLDLQLEPLEPIAAPAVVHDNPLREMRLHEHARKKERGK